MHTRRIFVAAIAVWLWCGAALAQEPEIRRLAGSREPPVLDAVVQPDADAGAAAAPVIAPAKPVNLSEQCRSGEADRQSCRFHWRSALTQSLEFASLQTGMNMLMASDVRSRTTHGKFFHNWFNSVSSIEWSRWNDGDPWYGNYVAHPMMGAVYSRIYTQNDPRGMGLPIGKSGAYWKSRLRAGLWAAAWAAQWEVGPLSESSVGNTGTFLYYSESSGKMTNGTGLTDFIATPAGGFVWGVGEDLIDRYIITRLEGVSANRGFLLATSILNPTRSMANLLRFKAPWHRDTRKVR